MKKIRSSYRTWRFRATWPCRLAAAVLVLGVPAGIWPQALVPQDAAAEPRELPVGVRINSVSAWVGRNYLLAPNAAGTPIQSYTLGYGGGVDAGLYLAGRTSRASLDYSLGYNGTPTYAELNGFDHNLSFSWTRSLRRTFSLSVKGTAESITVAGFLFQPVVNSAPDLSNAGALAGSLASVGTAGATQTILYPGRRQTATAAATLSHSASRRLSWQLGMHAQRLLPSSSSDPSTQQKTGYPGATTDGVDLSLSYSLSRRTSVGAEASYFRTVSQLGGMQAGAGGFSMTRVLSRRWFGSAQVGYGLGDYSTAASKTSVLRPDFTGRATLGTSIDAHMLTVSAGQRLGDSYGFGAQRTTDASLAWTWHPRQQKWSFQATGAYEWLTGLEASKIQSAVFRGFLTRRLTGTLSCAVEGGYMWGLSNSGSLNLGQQNQNGLRLSLVWRPGGTLW